MSDFIQVSTTVADRQNGERVAGLAMEKRLAGRVQVIGPTRSRWRGHAFRDHPDHRPRYLTYWEGLALWLPRIFGCVR